jgi:DNA polymerase III delta subunit
MLTLIHGDNQIASREKLTQLLSAFRASDTEVLNLEADKLDRQILETALRSNSLFGQEKLLVIDALHSLPKSAKKDELINLISDAAIDIILWEKKSLGKLELKKLSSDATAFEYKSSKQLWTFLDSLQSSSANKNRLLQLLHESCESESSEFVFLMLARQIRLLIQVSEGAPVKLAPFMIGKLERQARSFSLEQLLRLHQQLFTIDLKQKQSKNRLPLAAELDLWLINM